MQKRQKARQLQLVVSFSVITREQEHSFGAKIYGLSGFIGGSISQTKSKQMDRYFLKTFLMKAPLGKWQGCNCYLQQQLFGLALLLLQFSSIMCLSLTTLITFSP